jgi:hypothetical protein
MLFILLHPVASHSYYYFVLVEWNTLVYCLTTSCVVNVKAELGPNKTLELKIPSQPKPQLQMRGLRGMREAGYQVICSQATATSWTE